MWPTSTEWPGESRAALRFGLGILLSSVVALLLDLSSPSILPIVVATFIRPGTPRLPIKTSIALVLIVYVAFSIVRYLADLLLMTPGLSLVVVTWLVYLCFYAAARGLPAILVTFALVGVLMGSVVGTVSVELADALAGSMAITFAAALALSLLTHLLVPARPGEVEPSPKASGEAATAAACHQRALMSTLVMVPVVIGYQLFGNMDYMTALIYVGLILLTTDAEAGAAKGRGWVVANVVGGLFAGGLVLAQVAVGTQAFAITLSFFAAMVFGRAMAGRPLLRGTLGDAFTAFLMVFTADDAVTKVTSRLLQVFAVILYVGIMASALRKTRAPRPELAGAVA